MTVTILYAFHGRTTVVEAVSYDFSTKMLRYLNYMICRESHEKESGTDTGEPGNFTEYVTSGI
jgi:hypothetical protein